MSKNIFKEHKPGFIDVDPEPPYHFDTLDELLQEPQVKRFASGNGFKYFRQVMPSYGSIRLIAVEQDSHWVVGYLEQPVEGLKEWGG